MLSAIGSDYAISTCPDALLDEIFEINRSPEEIPFLDDIMLCIVAKFWNDWQAVMRLRHAFT